LPTRGLDRVALQDAVLRATLDGDTADLALRLRARGLLPTGPLAEAQLAELRRGFNDYVQLFEQWRGDAPETRLAIDLQLDGMRIHGHVEGVWGNGLGRIRPGEPGAGTQLRDGLDWLLANASGHPHALVQFHDVGDGPERCDRPALDPAAARDALRALLHLRRQGLREPLPWGPYTGWSYYSADRPDAALKKARERWEGGYDRWGERDGEAFRLTLRGRNLFDDAEVFQRFEEVNTRIFRALVEGRVFDGFTDDTVVDSDGATA